MKRKNSFGKWLILMLIVALLAAPVPALAFGGGGGNGGGGNGGGGDNGGGNGGDNGENHNGRPGGDARQGSENWHLCGLITAVPDGELKGEWEIDFEAFWTDENTTIHENHGELALEGFAHAVGYTDDEGVRIAYQLHSIDYPNDCQCNDTESWRIHGLVEAMPEQSESGIWVGAWQIGGLTVLTTETTRFHERFAPLEIGQYVVSGGSYGEDQQPIASMIGTIKPRAGDDPGDDAEHGSHGPGPGQSHPD